VARLCCFFAVSHRDRSEELVAGFASLEPFLLMGASALFFGVALLLLAAPTNAKIAAE